tara:strand:+ start:113561 stop:113902 length:342 start_codon:yes stop_codon:yes gene_type:complete
MIKIYHNPRCQKSREALKIVEESGKKFEIVKYLENSPSKKELREIVALLKIPVLDLVRKNETIWKENFKGKILSEDAILEALTTYPKLIERPIIINGTKAVIGRPPIKVAAII